MSAPHPTDPKIITVRPEPDSGYCTVAYSWHEEPKPVRIANWTVQKLAEGWKTELVTEAAW